MDGRGAAITGKEGKVNVDAPERGNIEETARQELPVSDDDDDIREPGRNLRET